MADITASVASWSTTEASNPPSGGTTVGTGLDDNLKAIQAGVRKEFAQSSDLAAAATIDLSTATGAYVEVTTSGTVTVTSLGTVAAGVRRELRFKSIGTALTLTHNATSLILPGAANLSVAAGDRAGFMSLGSGNWLCEWYTKADGMPPQATRFAIKSLTRDFTAASGNVSYTGVGFRPKAIVFLAATASGGANGSVGFADGSVNVSIVNSYNVTADTWSPNGSYSIVIYTGPSASDFQAAGPLSLDADGFTLEWVKSGTPPAGTANVYALCLR